MKWNFDGAFVGILKKGQELDTSDDSMTSLLWTTFLVTPLLPKGDIVCFSSTFDVRDNTDKVGKWVDAYAHHFVIDSQYSLCITDIEDFFPPKRSSVVSHHLI